MTSNGNAGVPEYPMPIRAIHPNRDASFRAVAPPKAEIRAARNSHVGTECSQCFKSDAKDGVDLRVCARCKSIWYCSKECQRKHWSVHKTQCREVERGTSKLIKAFLANQVLLLYLQVCLCLHFDLVNKPAPDTPFIARADVGLEPSDMSVFFHLYNRAYGNAEPEKIEGMLQINAVTPAPIGTTPHPDRLKSWRELREQLCADGEASTHAVIVEFISNTSGMGLGGVYPISAFALALAKEKKPLKTVSVITGESEILLTASSCLFYINRFIRADTENQLLLRMDMRKEDREIIRAAGRGDDTTAVSVLKEKMEREQMFPVRIVHQGFR